MLVVVGVELERRLLGLMGMFVLTKNGAVSCAVMTHASKLPAFRPGVRLDTEWAELRQRTTAAIIPARMSDRQQQIRDAFASYAEGDLEPLRALFDAEARWVGVPQGRLSEETPCCHDRAAIVRLLAQHYKNRRRFALGEMIEQGERVAVEFTVANPDWSGPVTLFKVFTFRPGENVVVRLNDCVDESHALQVLAA